MQDNIIILVEKKKRPLLEVVVEAVNIRRAYRLFDPKQKTNVCVFIM